MANCDSMRFVSNAVAGSKARLLVHDGVQPAAQRAAHDPQADHARHQHHERAELARTHHLPLLARLFQAPG